MTSSHHRAISTAIAWGSLTIVQRRLVDLSIRNPWILDQVRHDRRPGFPESLLLPAEISRWRSSSKLLLRCHLLEGFNQLDRIETPSPESDTSGHPASLDSPSVTIGVAMG